MKIKTPIYLPFAGAMVIYLALANYNGWSLVQTVAAKTWQRLNPNPQHK